MPSPTLLWYDYETTGTDAACDRPVQFAAARTDLELRPVDEPVSLYCAPVLDVLPQPGACLVTGIAPQDAQRDGVIEWDFAARVHELLAVPGTCSAGYNSIRFDDEVNRNLFHRNCFDPYEHAWRNGNSRWDLMDLARACYALRPEGIEWPRREGDLPSFKLEHLASANRLHQPRAHDAASDVEATLGLARLLRERQPRLYDWHFGLRDKKKVTPMLAGAMASGDALLHVSGRYPAERGCLAMVAVLAEHPERAGTFVVADLSVDPSAWIDLDPGDLTERLFTARADLPEDIERPPLKEIHTNRSPFLAPVSVLKGIDLARVQLDPAECTANLGRIRATHGLTERVRRVFAARAEGRAPREDPELALYAGFATDADRRRFKQARATPPAQLGATDFHFDDARYTELLFRARARNWPGTLSNAERERWHAWVREKLTRGTDAKTLTLDAYFAEIARLRAKTPPGAQQALLDRLQEWGDTVRHDFGL